MLESRKIKKKTMDHAQKKDNYLTKKLSILLQKTINYEPIMAENAENRGQSSRKVSNLPLMKKLQCLEILTPNIEKNAIFKITF